MSLTIRDLFNDSMALLGIYNQDYSPQTARDHVLADISAALQLMQMAGEEYYCRQEYNLSLVAGTANYQLPSTIQRILEPGRLASTGRTLIRLTTRSQYDNFGPLFLGTLDTLQNASPLAYFIDTLEPTSGSDSTSITVRVIPTPAAADTLTLYVIPTPPTYTANDLGASSPTPPVPHKYHESILLPLVRMNVTTCDLFSRNAARLPAIESAYQRALTLLGLADPNASYKEGVNPELRTAPQPK